MVSNIDPFHIHPSKDNLFIPVKMLAEDIDDLKKLIVGRLVSETLFDLALTKSVQTGVSVEGLLLQEGLMNEERYFQSLSNAIGVTYLPLTMLLNFSWNLQIYKKSINDLVGQFI